MPHKALNSPKLSPIMDSAHKHHRSWTSTHRRHQPWPTESERFADRTAAGRALGSAVADQLERPTHPGALRPLVLGLCRGGLLIAKEIAAALNAELDILVARKVGLPWRPSLGVAAIADEGPAVFDQGALASAGAVMSTMAPAVRRERLALRQAKIKYRGERPPLIIHNRTVIIADDGLTQGLTARAAIRAIRARGPASIIYAAPVCAAEAADWLEAEADQLIHLHSPRHFHALGLWYRDPTPVTDDDVTQILALTWYQDQTTRMKNTPGITSHGPED
jgi:putative phosphoribosyl transferase